jgi:Ca2+-binding RTX toxin-like protein
MPSYFIQSQGATGDFNSLSDLIGAKLRPTLLSDATEAFLTAQGAVQLILSVVEIPAALITGVIDGAVADRLDVALYLLDLDPGLRVQSYEDGTGFGALLDRAGLIAEAGLTAQEGTSAGELLEGGGAGDYLIGGGGNDTLLGKAGDDVLSLFGGSLGELSGGTGNDTLYGSNFADLLKGGKDQDVIFGGNGDDVIRGQSHGDWMSGGFGADNIKGGGGNDTLLGDEGNDFLKGGTRRDLLEGGEGNDALAGNSFDDTLIGGAGHDKLLGGGDDDRLEAGTGADTLKGGDGADVFVFVNETRAGIRNLVTDFDLAEDRLEITSDALPGADAAALVAAAQITAEGVLLALDRGEILLQGMTSTAGLADVIDII